jgi:elongation factor G
VRLDHWRTIQCLESKGILLDVEVRPEAASEMAFKAATSMAFRECMTELTKREQTQLLEPIMKLEVSGPDEYIGNVVGDLNSRRGRIQSISVKPGGGQIILAQVPLAGSLRLFDRRAQPESGAGKLQS